MAQAHLFCLFTLLDKYAPSSLDLIVEVFPSFFGKIILILGTYTICEQRMAHSFYEFAIRMRSGNVKVIREFLD